MKIKSFSIVIGAVNTILVGALISSSLFLLHLHQKNIEVDHRLLNSKNLAEELRQSSDDLTRMARSYVNTGDSIYIQYYFAILDIRNGTRPRPDNYSATYWYLNKESQPRMSLVPAKGAGVPLQELMRRAGFRDEEFSLLKTSQAQSDLLVETEKKAFAAMTGLFENGRGGFTIHAKPNQEYARRLMYGREYLTAKSKIMEPISRFIDAINQRTSREQSEIVQQTHRWQLIALMIGIIMLASFLLTSIYVRRIILIPIGKLEGQVDAISEGNNSIRNDIQTKNELGTLGKHFNTMADRFDTWHAELETQVRERTKQLSEANDILTLRIAERKRAEEQIMVLQHTIEASPDGAYWMDKDGKFVYTNEAGYRVLGYSKEEILQMSVFDVSPYTTPERWKQIWQYIKEHGSYVSQSVHRRKDGTEYPVEISSTYIKIDEQEYCNGFAKDITERKQAEEALREKMFLLQTAHELAIIGSYRIDLISRTIFMSAEMSRLYGAGDKEIILPLEEYRNRFYHPDDLEEKSKTANTAYDNKKPFSVESRVIRDDGKVIWVQAKSNVSQDQTTMLGMVQDITERKQVQAKILKLSRLYNTLSQVNTAIVHSTNQEDLFYLICKRVVEQGKFLMAWVGLVDEVTHKVNPICHFGDEQGYLTNIFISTDDITEGRGPTGTSIRENRVNYINNFLTDERIQPWSKSTSKSGFKSSVALPLRLRDKVIGALTMYSRESDFFDAEQLELMDEMADDISFALENFAHDAERLRVEEALRVREMRYRSVLESISLIGVMLDRESNITLCNDFFLNLTGWKREEVLNRNYFDIFVPDDIRASIQRSVSMQSVADGAIPTHFENEIVTRNGERRMVAWNNTVLREADGSVIGVSAIGEDITERRKAEENLRLSEEKFSKAFYGNVAVMTITRVSDGIFLDVNEQFIQKTGYSREETVGKTAAEVKVWKHDDDRARFVLNLRQGGVSINEEYIFVRKSGEEMIGLVSAQLSKLQDQDVIITSISDITERKQAEKALRETTDYLENLLSFANAPIMVWDNNNKITRFNLAFEKLTGYTIFDVAGKHPEILFPAKMREDLSALLSRTSEGENLISVEMPILCKNGSTRIVLWNTANIYSEDGQTMNATIAIGQDITERKQVERKVLESEKRFKAIIEQSPIAIALLDMKGHPVVSNAALSRMVGYSTDELSHMTFAEFTYPEDAEKDVSQFNALLEGKISEYNMEKRYVHKNGDLVWGNLHVTVRCDKNGFPEEIIGMAEDITERKQAEEALRKSEEMLKSIFASSPDSITVADLQGRIILCNQAAVMLHGFSSKDQIIGKTFYELIAEEERQRAEESMRQVIMEGIVKDVPFIGLKGSSEKYDGELSVSILKDNLGKPNGFVGITKDITQRKQLEKQIRQTQKVQSIGTLAGGIAHDFNNILGIILAYSSVLERTSQDPNKFAQSIKSINSAVNRGAALVRQILTFARQTDVSIKPMSVLELAHEVVAMLQETFPKVIEFRKDFEKGVPLISADHSQIHQAVLNLCVNARDAMPKGGVITVGIRTFPLEKVIQQFPGATFEQYVCLSVSDTGTGMDETTKSRIFDPFFTTKELGKGTGLGLSVVFGVVQSHYGFISVDSEVGEGTTFHLYFPVPQEFRKGREEKEKKLTEPKGGTETILFIEDEELLRTAVQSELELSGYTVHIAVDGLEAIEVFKQHQKEISLVLTDIGLPKKSGVDIFHQLRQINPKIKIILASGFISPDQKSELMKDGANEFIQKPYVLTEVLYKIREVLDEK
jgi:two-component system, cell cycle sensor histidine kinase and response regulator CckA